MLNDSQQCCKMHHKLAIWIMFITHFANNYCQICESSNNCFNSKSLCVADILTHSSLPIFDSQRDVLLWNICCKFLTSICKVSLTIYADLILALIFWYGEYLSHGMIFILNIIAINKYKNTSRHTISKRKLHNRFRKDKPFFIRYKATYYQESRM